MKQFRLQELKSEVSTHIFESFLPGKEIYKGGMFFHKPGEVTHANDHGSSVHVHEDCELFFFYQGKAEMEVDGVRYPAGAGDLFLIEPGEDHHMILGPEDYAVGTWCHATEMEKEI